MRMSHGKCMLLFCWRHTFEEKLFAKGKIDQHIGREEGTGLEMKRKLSSLLCTAISVTNSITFCVNCMFWQFATLLSMRNVSPMSSRHARVLRRVWSRILSRIVGQSRRTTREDFATSVGSDWMKRLPFIAWVSFTFYTWHND